MRKGLVGILLGMFVMSSASAFATTVQSQFFSGLQQWSDNSAEYLLNYNPTAGTYSADDGDTIIATGDKLRGLFDIQTIEDLTGVLPDRLVATGGVNQFTGIFEADVIVGGGPGAYTFNLTPSASFQAIYGTGAMLALYQSPTLNYTRLGGTDDIPGAAAEEALIATATHDGAAFLVFGFKDWANLNYTFGEGWFSTSPTNDIALVGAIPPPGNGGTVNFALNLLSTTLTGYDFNQVGTSFGAGGVYNPFAGGTAQLAGSTNLLGTAGVVTPFNVFDNTDLVVNVEQVPEPGTIALLGLGLIGIGVYSRRRVKK